MIIEKRRAWAWGVLVASAVTCGLAVAFGGGATTVDEVTSVPAAAESTEVTRLLQQLPSSRIEPAIVVYSRDGQQLTPGDRAAVDADARAFAGVAVDGVVPPPVFADGGAAALVTVPLPADLSTEAVVDTVAGLRAQARDGLPAGCRWP